MATLFVDKIDPQSGTSLEIGSSGDTITTATGAKPSFLYPAFEARLSSDQTISDDTLTKINLNEEVFDTDSAYDNSTNYRFTPQVAGKYFVYWVVCGIASSNNVVNSNGFIYKNGSQYNGANILGNSAISGGSTTAIASVIMNGSSDYLEFYLKIDAASGAVRADHDFSGGNTTYAGAYRIGS